ncbi:MAG TPA: LysR family transcriptional regulator [Gaiellaceae bacterium]|nr:LysR family transcriptional regulator [Gaiellaceae bacterium]
MRSISRHDQWLGVELRHLAALQAVAREGTFGRAAAALGYTQSAISQQIATLERLVGARLLERPGGPKPVSLTEAGELLLRHADGILARLHAAQADLAALSDGWAGRLRVGTYQSVGARILPEVLRRFSGAWPQVEVTLTESADDLALMAAVERGELDLAFVMLPVEEGPFAFLELMRDPYVLVVPGDSELARRGKPATRKDLEGLSLIGFRSCRSVAEVEAHLRVEGSEPNVVFRSDDNGTVQGLVAAGMGVAFVPHLAVEPTDERVAVLELAPGIPPREIGIAWHRDRYRSPAAAAFVETAQVVCRELELHSDEALAV